MENITSVISKIKSGVVSVSFYQNEQKIASGTAFLCKNKIISNNHVFHPDGGSFPDDTNVKFKISGSEFDFKYNELSNYVVTGSVVNSNDYIVLDMNDENFFKDKFQFELGNHGNVAVGDQILIEGYPFEHENLVSHIGYVSAKYIESDINIIQIDASVNSGNSGGPLIDLRTLKVVGIVTRKATGLIKKQFDDLIQSFQTNIDLFEKLKKNGSIKLKGVDPLEYMEISQNQMKIISQNIKRSANVGIGYAFSCDKLKGENFYQD